MMINTISASMGATPIQRAHRHDVCTPRMSNPTLCRSYNPNNNLISTKTDRADTAESCNPRIVPQVICETANRTMCNRGCKHKSSVPGLIIDVRLLKKINSYMRYLYLGCEKNQPGWVRRRHRDSNHCLGLRWFYLLLRLLFEWSEAEQPMTCAV